MKTIIKRIPISEICMSQTQTRAGLNQETVSEYAADMKEGMNFPAITVYQDDGSSYWLSDGFHRVAASQVCKFMEIDAEVRKGGRRDAILNGAKANSAHGLRRTNQDKRHCVELLLKDEEWSTLSDRAIAEMCGVSNVFVSSLRPQVLTVNTSSSSDDSGNFDNQEAATSAEPTKKSSRRIGKDGKSYPAAARKSCKTGAKMGKPGVCRGDRKPSGGESSKSMKSCAAVISDNDQEQATDVFKKLIRRCMGMKDTEKRKLKLKFIKTMIETLLNEVESQLMECAAK